MILMYYIVIFLFALPSLLVLIDLFKFLFTDSRLHKGISARFLEIIIIIVLPLLFLIENDFGKKNDCCSGSAFFSPAHRTTIYVLILLCIISFFYSTYRKSTSPPVLEIIINSFLLIGVILNIFISIHLDSFVWIFGNFSIIVLFIFRLIDNQKELIAHCQEIDFQPTNLLEIWAWKILKLKTLYKIPILFILCLPILAIVTAFLLLFGQKPDSAIRAFTDTYKQGLSQLDYMCNNVECGGHFLCSIAAKGHKNIVKPERLGWRAGNPIICNRQLLISNAFEELVEQKFPVLHKILRRNYNKVGNFIHRYYAVFNNKFIADFIYLLMKPLEYCFLLILYTFDQKPENRIAKQYLKPTDMQQLNGI